MTTSENSHELIGKRYVLHEKLGQGGMGAVYRATDRLTGQIVALKRVFANAERLEFASHTAAGDSIGLRLALAQEFRTLASLRHPHIISVLDYGFDDGRQPFFTMDFMQGGRSLVSAGRDKTIAERINLLVQTLQALAYLHRRGVIHRDLKPENVLVGEAVKMLDFGLAVGRGQGDEEEEETAGTLAYIAPEVLQGSRATEASDLYAIGVMIYEMLVGRHPFNTANAGQLVMDVLMKPPDLSPLALLSTEQDTALLGEVAEQQNTGEADDTFVGRDNLTEVINRGQVPDLSDMMDEIEQDMVFSITSASSDLPTLATIVDRLMAKSPELRYQDPYEVIDLLCAAIGQAAPEESAAIRESFLQAATFVGRDTELSQLSNALVEASEGRGSVWLVGGVSGTGKSRLLDELRTRALVQGMNVLRGQAVIDGGLPYHLWREPLRRLLLTTEIDDLDAGILKDIIPDIEALLDRPVPDAVFVEGLAYKQRMVGTIASMFQRQTQPILLLVEDLQWASESLDVLRVIVGMAGELPLLIVGSYRIEETPDLPASFPGINSIKLERLQPDSIAALSVSMLGEGGRQSEVLELLQRETEGNVYFLIEVVRALAEEAGRLDQVGKTALPKHVFAGGIQNVMKRRLARVPESYSRLVHLAAIAGRELDLNVLEHVKGNLSLEDWLITCANYAVLEVQEGGWRFAHDKLRQAAVAAIPEEERPQFHREVAQAIEKAYPDNPDQAAILAHHWRQAGDPQKEFKYTQQAGELALQTSGFVDAVNFLGRALELLPRLQLSGKGRKLAEAGLLVKLGDAVHHTGDYPRATTYIEHGLELSRELKDKAGIARALNLLGDVSWRKGDYAGAERYCREALEISRALGDERGIARALNRIGIAHYEQGDLANAVPNFEESLAYARSSGDQQILAGTINNLGIVAYAQGDYDRAQEYFEETLALARASGERRSAASALLNLSAIAGGKQNFADVQSYLEECLTICRTIGERRGVALALNNLGYLNYDQEQYDRAIQYYEESLAISRAIGNRQGTASTLVNLGDIARARSRPEIAFDFYQEALEIAQEIDATPTIMGILTGLAEVTDDEERVLKWLAVVLQHPATFENIRKQAEAALEKYKTRYPPETIEAIMESARSINLGEIVNELLQKS